MWSIKNPFRKKTREETIEDLVRKSEKIMELSRKIGYLSPEGKAAISDALRICDKIQKEIDEDEKWASRCKPR